MTHGTNQNKSRTIRADAITQPNWEGKTIEPGQKIRYIIHDHFRKKSRRVIPMEIITPDDSYDAKRYSELLEKCCKSMVEPFE
ncbi:MAG: hypothetical protein OEX98_04985 [Nitrosopumilus sp.]|nr:hypothetical protein [Nitrosopumilus sp.]